MPKKTALTFEEFGRSEIISLSDNRRRPQHGAPHADPAHRPRRLGPRRRATIRHQRVRVSVSEEGRPTL